MAAVNREYYINKRKEMDGRQCYESKSFQRKDR